MGKGFPPVEEERETLTLAEREKLGPHDELDGAFSSL